MTTAVPNPPSVKGGLKLRRHQRNMGFERRPELECACIAGKVEQTHQAPFMATGVCDLELVARDIKRRALPSVRRFHLDQSWQAIGREAGNIIACAVTVLLGDPADLRGQIPPTLGRKMGALVMENTLFASCAKRAVSLVPSGHVKSAGDCFKL